MIMVSMSFLSPPLRGHFALIPRSPLTKATPSTSPPLPVSQLFDGKMPMTHWPVDCAEESQLTSIVNDLMIKTVDTISS